MNRRFFCDCCGGGGNLLWKAQSFLAPKEAVSPRFLDIKRPPIRWRRNVWQSFIEIGRILKKLWSNFVNTVKMDMGTRPKSTLVIGLLIS